MVESNSWFVQCNIFSSSCNSCWWQTYKKKMQRASRLFFKNPQKNAGATSANERHAIKWTWSEQARLCTPWECNEPAALYIINDYITGLSTHLCLSPVEVLNKYRSWKNKTKRRWIENCEQTASCRQRSSVAAATGNVLDTNIGESLCSLSSTGITCAETSRTRRLLTFPWRVLWLRLLIICLLFFFFLLWEWDYNRKEVSTYYSY